MQSCSVHRWLLRSLACCSRGWRIATHVSPDQTAGISPQVSRPCCCVEPLTHTDTMTRRITETFHGYNQPEILVTFPDDHDHPGEHQGVLRAWAVDDETGEWSGMCNYTVAPGVTYLGWIHQDQLRRDGDLGDNDGLTGPVPTDQLTVPAPLNGELYFGDTVIETPLASYLAPLSGHLRTHRQFE